MKTCTKCQGRCFRLCLRSEDPIVTCEHCLGSGFEPETTAPAEIGLGPFTPVLSADFDEIDNLYLETIGGE